jgi:cell division protein FtsI (penicillin-binding protein 3)
MNRRILHAIALACLATSLLVVACGGSRRTTSALGARLPVRSDVRVEAVVEDELVSLLGQPDIRSARIVVLSVDDGAVLAANGRDRSGPHASLATEGVRSHGSTGKLFTIAAALEAGAVSMEDTFEGGVITRDGVRIEDHEQHGVMSLEDVMAFSSNVGTTRVFDRLGAGPLAGTLSGFRLSVPDDFGSRPGRDAQIAYGALLEATSLDVAAGYLVVARGGTWPGGRVVISPTTADRSLALLERAVSRADATGHAATTLGIRVAGKTGTVRLEGGGTFGVFVGILPVGAPQYVVLVGIEASGEGYSGSTLAAPSFVRVAGRLG